jgi:hypothetical protein
MYVLYKKMILASTILINKNNIIILFLLFNYSFNQLVICRHTQFKKQFNLVFPY